MDTLSKLIGENWFKFILGWGYIGILFTFLSYLTFAKVWQATIEYYGIPFVVVIIIAPPLLFISSWYIGDFVIRKNLLSHQISLQNRDANPEFKELCENTRLILKELTK
jgi:hypothetical protein